MRLARQFPILATVAFSTLSATTAIAAPTYLKCVIAADTSAVQVEITLDEAAGQATVYLPSTGRASKSSAVFRPGEVLFNDGDVSYSVSRTDFTIVRTVRAYKWVDNGQCELQTNQKRAF